MKTVLAKNNQSTKTIELAQISYIYATQILEP